MTTSTSRSEIHRLRGTGGYSAADDYGLNALFGRRDRRAVYNGGRWQREDGDPGELTSAHCRGELHLGSHHGGTETTHLFAFDVDGGSHASLTARTGERPDPAGAVHALAELAGKLKLMPALVASSKSAEGYHVYFLLAEPVPIELAHRVAGGMKEALGRAEIDKCYPSTTGDGLVLALPLCGIEGGHPAWVREGGSRFVHGSSLTPFLEQREVPLAWPPTSKSRLEAAAEQLGVLVEKNQPVQSKRPALARAYEPVPRYRNHLDVLADSCAFIEHAASNASELNYEAWFSLATILKYFPGGAWLFDRISSRDPARYSQGEPSALIDSVKGPPRHCVNLGWQCPRLNECGSLGVRSPAGLPFKLTAKRGAA